jgi:hypothetical protein
MENETGGIFDVLPRGLMVKINSIKDLCRPKEGCRLFISFLRLTCDVAESDVDKALLS